jgi:hypothetical protein
MSKYIWYCGESQMCLIRWRRYTTVEAVLWLGERELGAQYRAHEFGIVPYGGKVMCEADIAHRHIPSGVKALHTEY